MDLLALHKIRKLFPRHTLRSYIVGCSVIEDEVTLWYADRMGIITTKPFNLFKDGPLLVLLAVAFVAS